MLQSGIITGKFTAQGGGGVSVLTKALWREKSGENQEAAKPLHVCPRLSD